MCVCVCVCVCACMMYVCIYICTQVGFNTADTVLTIILKTSVLGTTGVAYFFVYRYYNILLQIQRANGVELRHFFVFFSTNPSPPDARRNV